MTVIRLPGPSTPGSTTQSRAGLPRQQTRPLPSAARDRQLVRAAALGDALAWDQLVEDHAQEVWEIAVAAQLRSSEAAAVCEVVWLLLVEALPETDGLPVAVWLRRTTTTESHLAYVRAHPRPPVADRRRHERRITG